MSHAAPKLQAFMAYLNDPGTATTTDYKLISSLQQEVDAVKKESEAREEYMKLELLLKEQHKDGYKEGKAEGLAEGMEKGLATDQARLCKRMYANNLSVEEISKLTGLDAAAVQTLLEAATE